MRPAFDHRPPLPEMPDGLSLEFCRRDDDRDMTLAAARASLTPAERARAARFRFDRDAHRYIRGRGMLRRALSARLGLAPGAVPLTEGARKKPELAVPGPGFNFSNSGALGVLVLREGGAVGVDLELADRALDPLALAPNCFQDHETAVLAALPEPARLARFLAFWTAKEALMKLTGEGMYLAPTSIGLRLEDGLPVGFDAPAPHRGVTLFCPTLQPECHLALAWE